MIISFKNSELKELFENSKVEGKKQFSKAVIKHYQKKVLMLVDMENLKQVSQFASLNLEKLNSKKYKNCYSIRVNDQFRLIFKVLANGDIEILILELSKHYE